MRIPTPVGSADDTTVAPESDIPDLLASWRRHLTAQRMAKSTLDNYSWAVNQLHAFLADHGMPVVAANIRREHVEAFVTGLLENWKPATAHNRYRSLNTFFRWLLDEGEIKTSPMERMKPPRLPDEPPPVLLEPELRRLLALFDKDRTFEGRRDEAILRVFMDTGIRRAELLGIRTSDVDLDTGRITVTGKGDRKREVQVGLQTVRAIDRYLRLRSKHRVAAVPDFWLGRKGVLRARGLAQIIAARGVQAGLKAHLHPHLFRHAYAHSMLAAGMQEHDLMAVAGWKTPEMLARYARATRAERALTVAKRLSPVDRLEEPGR